MRFRVCRTSGKIPPCAQAVMIEGRWFIEVADLPELVAFIKTCGEGQIVFDGEEIEIYDDYR